MRTLILVFILAGCANLPPSRPMTAHEAAHHLAACVLGHSDRRHTRADLWVDAVYGANARFLAAYPAETPDPHEVPGPPWDLSGTPYEGDECFVQPPGYQPATCGDGGI
jgi:hypothetical protein